MSMSPSPESEVVWAHVVTGGAVSANQLTMTCKGCPWWGGGRGSVITGRPSGSQKDVTGAPKTEPQEKDVASRHGLCQGGKGTKSQGTRWPPDAGKQKKQTLLSSLQEERALLTLTLAQRASLQASDLPNCPHICVSWCPRLAVTYYSRNREPEHWLTQDTASVAVPRTRWHSAGEGLSPMPCAEWESDKCRLLIWLFL